MRIRWFGQSAFLLSDDDGSSVFIDPFGDLGALAGGKIRFGYPPVDGVESNLLLITHEHADHNAAERVGGSPQIIRSTAGRFESPVGEVVAIASEHDAAAGTERGPNTIFTFPLDGVTVCHFGDFGQSGLRPEQREAIGDIDVLLLPVGDGPTIGGRQAADVVEALAPALVIPMHYRTPSIDFLEGPEAFLASLPGWGSESVESDEVNVDPLPERQIVLLSPPQSA